VGKKLLGGSDVGLGELGGPVERAYLVNVNDLCDICDAHNDGQREYKLTCNHEKTVAFSYNDGPDDLNSVIFTFSIAGNLNWPPRVFGKQFLF